MTPCVYIRMYTYVLVQSKYLLVTAAFRLGSLYKHQTLQVYKFTIRMLGVEGLLMAMKNLDGVCKLVKLP